MGNQRRNTSEWLVGNNFNDMKFDATKSCGSEGRQRGQGNENMKGTGVSQSQQGGFRKNTKTGSSSE